jgi:undecaprenyl-diphosphatase
MDLIELLRYILYGIVQGFLEVLPISSSGHVAFLQAIAEDDFSYSSFFLIIVNSGSLAAIIIYFKSTLKELIDHSYSYWIKKEDKREYIISSYYVKSILVGIIPVAVIGTIYTLSDVDLGPYTLIIIGLGGLLTSTILFLSRRRTDMFTSTKVTPIKAWRIGLLQVLSVIPGVSRLAVTATEGTRQQLSYETSLKFSLLMSIPISIGTILVSVIRGFININTLLDFDTSNPFMYVYYFIALVVSFVGTIYALKFIFIITKKGNFRLFYIYNLIFGMVALFIGLLNF